MGDAEMNCKQFAKYITDYVDGTLDNGVAGEMDMHMNVCHECSVLVTELENTSSLIRSLDRSTAPDGFEAQIRRRISSAPAGKPRGILHRLAGTPSRRPFVLRPVFAAFVLSVALIGSTFVMVQRTYFSEPGMDWEYIKECQSQHASFASANPLADDSAIILTERARDLGEEL